MRIVEDSISGRIGEGESVFDSGKVVCPVEPPDNGDIPGSGGTDGIENGLHADGAFQIDLFPVFIDGVAARFSGEGAAVSPFIP